MIDKPLAYRRRPENLEEVSPKDHTEKHLSEKNGVYSEAAKKRLSEYHISKELSNTQFA